jgi:DNA-binding transcriptional ArsR family regulator
MTVTARFDEIIHPSTRLSIVAMLAAADWVEFAFVRDRLQLSDSALSKQFATLEDAGYIAIERPVSERRRRVRVRLTAAGRDAFQGHVAALQLIVAAANTDTEPGRAPSAPRTASSPTLRRRRSSASADHAHATG